jgi:pimeloyl-ACP methyl ester carboxylesterase
MKKIQKTIILLFLAQLSFGQNLNIINNQAIHFSLKQKKDTIDFIVVDTKTDVKKPIFLFCQGSLPVPLFVKPEKEEMWMIGGGITNFDLNEIKKNYHLIVISMPKTPVIVNEKNLNKSYCYIPNPNEPDEFGNEYTESDYLENYEKRANEVLKFLRKQKWVDNSKLVVAGHSQGSKVATVIALNNKNVTHLGLFGANPFGRIDQRIRDYRKNAESKQITWQEADQKIDSTYQMLRNSYNADTLKKEPYLLAWKSFSRPLLNDWLKIKVPTYLAYGTNDIASDLCDLVPLFYIQNSKTNLTYKRYLNLEHNFFEVNEDGEANYEKEHWKEVMSSFVKWTLK